MTNKTKQNNMTNKSNRSNRTYKSYRTYITYVFLLALLFSFFPQSSTPARAGYLSRPPTSLGLVGYWPMDEGAGSKAGDFSGSGNTGTITGATWTDGRHGKALNFLQANNSRVTGSPSKTGFTNLTISFWFRPTGAQSLTGIYSWADTIQDGNPWIIFQRENPTTARWYFNGNYRVSLAIKDNTWYQTTVTYDGTTWVVYLNGVFSGSYVGGIGSDGGGYQWFGSGYQNYFSGKMDDIRVYNRALTASEISKLYSSGQTTLKKVSEQGLVGYWSMNEAQGGKVGDSSGNNNTGTITGATWADGKKGKGLSFNGSEVATVSNSPFPMRGTNTMTASAWVKRQSPTSTGGILNYSSEFAFGIGVVPCGVNSIKLTKYTVVDVCIGNFPTDTQFHLMTAVWNSSGVFLYIDGVLNDSSANNQNFANGATTDLHIGYASNDNDYFSGVIDDVRIYNRALSVGEIQSLYKQNETMANAPQNNKLTNGLVGLWSFNGKDVSGTTAYDRSGQGNNGNITGGAKLDAGKVGQGMSFDGVDDYVVSTSVVNIAKTTISAWVKISSYPPPRGLVVGFINGIGSGTHDKNLMIGADGKVYFYVFDGATKTTSAPTTAIPLNTWVHIVGTADGINAKAYLNGVEVGTVAAGNTYTSYTVPNIFISGATGSPVSGGGYMKQQVDEVRIYNRALSADEVKQLYRMGQ